MNSGSDVMAEYEVIARSVQHHIDGTRAGSGATMQAAFHDDAQIFGFASDGLFAAPIQQLFDRVDKTGPAPRSNA